MIAPIRILFGTETGNAEECAKDVANAIQSAGFSATVTDMDDFKPSELSNELMAIIVTSTYGNGDPPSNAEALMEWLEQPSSSVQGVSFAVCGLGDQIYPNFCQAGIDFDRLMGERGGIRVVNRKDCDEFYEEPLAEFINDITGWIRLHGETVLSEKARATDTEHTLSFDKKPTEPKAIGTRSAPVSATLSARRRLNEAGSNKETMHYEFTWHGSQVDYAPGDSFAVMPINNAAEVTSILSQLTLDGAQQVIFSNTKISLNDALLTQLDLQTVTAKLLSILAQRSGGMPPHVEEKYLADRHLVDVLRENPAATIEAQTLVDNLRSLKPRLYSVANSPLVEPHGVHFTAETLRYTRMGRPCEGVATTWLADRVNNGDTVSMYCVPATYFRLPDDPSVPVIMIGPGTGIAPFRAFLQHRKTQGGSGPNWLFFGHQHEGTDFLYRDELLACKTEGLLTKLSLAWSRDQAEKVYVQHRLLEHGADVWNWLKSGASVYVCGDKHAMAPQVRDAFVDILVNHGQFTQHQASEVLDDWERSGRYCVDAY